MITQDGVYNISMDLLEQYMKEIGEDLIVDDFNIKSQQMRLPSRKHFWVGRLIHAKIHLQKLKTRREDVNDRAAKKVIELSPVAITASRANKLAQESKASRDIRDEMQEYELIIEYLEKVERVMNQMGYDIKNIIELQKLEQL